MALTAVEKVAELASELMKADRAVARLEITVARPVAMGLADTFCTVVAATATAAVAAESTVTLSAADGELVPIFIAAATGGRCCCNLIWLVFTGSALGDMAIA